VNNKPKISSEIFFLADYYSRIKESGIIDSEKLNRLKEINAVDGLQPRVICHDGQCVSNPDGTYSIKISRHLSKMGALLTLNHEIAHIEIDEHNMRHLNLTRRLDKLFNLRKRYADINYFSKDGMPDERIGKMFARYRRYDQLRKNIEKCCPPS
jgi:hypothetical protein